MNEITNRLDTIQEHVTGDRAEFDQGGYEPGSDICLQDREFLLDLTRKQQAALDAVRDYGQYLRHEHMSAKETALADGWDQAVKLIRTAVDKALDAQAVSGVRDA